ncbi:Integral membrane protein [Niallia circulans]|uniref:Membrane protein n=2 Tax=Niallia circulans TaxID=1397 RepID=A0A0J1LG57_NIACI|nr:DUF975 family protein [Niallia circulans]KLV28105.1 membrane protein [Niallia circulans]MDR4314934.1 DUF975 family protein [Niallia circulans]MED3837749.1 DUF975 family protein [Niallia circulans]MED4243105.1 DUF975 family protein [Niallia circulans]MED4247084.1 DUF975 family protein [Niallia circulans]
MKISAIKREAREYLKGEWGKAVGLTFLYFILSAGVNLSIEIYASGGFMNWIYQDYAPPQATILNTIISLLLIPLSISIVWFYLDIVREKNTEISQVFTIYTDVKTMLKLIGTSIMIGIFTFLWSLLLLIPGIIKALAYSQTFMLLKDHPEYSVFEAITESRRRMKGYKGKYFLLNLSFIGWGILCLFTLGIGFLWLAPYIYTSNATFYQNLIADNEKETI